MAAGKVGGGRTVALLTVVAVAVAVAALVPGGSCLSVAAAAPAGGVEAERCVRRCARGMLACAAAAAGCASLRATTSGASRRESRDGGRGGEGSAACGRGCENEYLGCIDVC